MYDLVIRNGTIIDGSGLPRYKADVAIADNRIAEIGRIRTKGKQELDAEGQVVSPGFIDGHTHMDAQVFWDPLGSCSCWHGVTTVVMGNCGFTLAPGKVSQRELIVSNIERAEDISAEAMNAAIQWDWTTFSEYLQVVDRLPKAINYAANLGHSALRTYVMGQRAFEEEASPHDLRAMENELLSALSAGAIGFTTSRNAGHQTPDNRPVASVHASWEEIRHLVGAMGSNGRGIFELARGDNRNSDPAVREINDSRLRTLAVETGVPITFGIPAGGAGCKANLDLLDSTAAAGGRMFGQTHPRGISHVLSFKSRLQFDDLPEWNEVRSLPLTEQKVMLESKEVRQRLMMSAQTGAYKTGAGQPRKPDYQNMYVMNSTIHANPTVAEIALQRNVDPIEVMIDLAIDSNFNQLFMQFDARTMSNSEAETLSALRHPRTVMTFSDSGAHVSLIMDSSIHTHFLAYWVRERQAFTLEEAVKMITLTPALLWGFVGRGLVREGYIADLNVFDPEQITPELPTLVSDLPAGARRLRQTSKGIRATIIGGRITFNNGEHTGSLEGRLLRSSHGGVG